MGFGALRSLVRPLSRALTAIPRPSASARTASFAAAWSKEPEPLPSSSSFRGRAQWWWRWSPISKRSLHSLTDTRFPKRRPSDKPRRKRATMRPPGPYKLVQYVPGEPIAPKPNEGSVKRRNEKKRIRLRKAFILAEKKKRKAQLQEANRKKKIKRVERKMAAVARERAWAERLAELQRLEEEKKKSMA